MRLSRSEARAVRCCALHVGCVTEGAGWKGLELPPRPHPPVLRTRSSSPIFAPKTAKQTHGGGPALLLLPALLLPPAAPAAPSCPFPLCSHLAPTWLRALYTPGSDPIESELRLRVGPHSQAYNQHPTACRRRCSAAPIQSGLAGRPGLPSAISA